MYYYIVNPAAGNGSINRLQDKIRGRLTELGIDGEFAKTTGAGDAAKMAEAAIARGINTIVAVGGDGTVNEVLNGITKDNVAVGIIPIGNSNQLARHFGIGSWQKSCDILAARRLTPYGLIAAGQNFFLSTLTLGFETDLDKQVETTEGSGLRTRAKQFREGWRHAQEFKPLSCKIKVDDAYEIEAPLFSLTVANQKFENSLADNKLVITITDKPSRVELSRYLWSLLKRDNEHDVATTRIKADKVVIETTPPTGLMIDGKLSGRTPIAIRLTDRRIRFITEKQSVDFKTTA